MKVGDLVRRCPHYWSDVPELTEDERGQLGIIVQYEKAPAWHHTGEYFVVLWSDGDCLDWKEEKQLEVVHETR